MHSKDKYTKTMNDTFSIHFRHKPTCLVRPRKHRFMLLTPKRSINVLHFIYTISYLISSRDCYLPYFLLLLKYVLFYFIRDFVFISFSMEKNLYSRKSIYIIYTCSYQALLYDNNVNIDLLIIFSSLLLNRIIILKSTN